MQKAVSYARVSSKEQELGFSLESQVNTYRGYAASNGFLVVKEFKFSESAKQQGRKHFNEMLDFLRRNRDVRIVLVEKTDRLSRNLHDFVMVEDLVEELDIEIHLIKEGQVLRKAAKSQDRLVQGIFALLARNYIQNMQEEIQKGQLVKAEKGQYPGRALFGYAHDRETRTIMAHPAKASVVKLLFELYSSGEFSVDGLRKKIIEETGERISKSMLHKILKSRFYLGLFTWRGREYQGIHPPLVDSATFDRVQDIITGRNGNKLKARKHNFPFSSLLNCAADGCAITAERHKEKYIYYRCSYGRGKHKFPPLPEQKLADMLGTVLKQIEIPAEVAQTVELSIQSDQAGMEAKRREETNRVTQRITALQSRMRRAYEDKLDGRIDESFWRVNNDDWSAEEVQLRAALESVSKPVSKNQGLALHETLELAQSAHSVYFTLDYVNRARLLKKVLLNCVTDGVSLNPSYSKPFDLIFERAKNEEWRREWDSNPRYSLKYTRFPSVRLKPLGHLSVSVLTV